MTGAAVVAAVVAGVLIAWRVEAHKRRLRRARERLEAVAPARDERAARAALRPHTGHVAPFPVHPTTNGKP
jgi:hypothetical protein